RDGQGQTLGRLLSTPSDQLPWEHARCILCEDFHVTDVAAGLRALPAMLDTIARAVESSKRKDDERGVRIIDDYADVHVQTGQDPVVRQTWEETRRLQQEIEELVGRLPSARTTLGPLVERQPVPQEVTAGARGA